MTLESAGATVPEPTSGDALLSRAQAGDVSAFEALVEQQKDRVYAVALRMTRSEADAAEIVQDTFLAAYRNLQSFRGEAAFGSWVHRIAANNSLMRLRHRRVVERTETDLLQPGFSSAGHLLRYPQQWERPADEQALDAELGVAIQQSTDLLPDEYREVFLLKDVEGLSYDEIAEATGDSVPAIKSRLHRARLALREAIDRFYSEK